MRIASLTLKKFKRFTELEIADVPANAKLVLLVGSNGSGKSSVFDAFGFLSTPLQRGEHAPYHRKDSKEPFFLEAAFHDGRKVIWKNGRQVLPSPPATAFLWTQQLASCP